MAMHVVVLMWRLVERTAGVLSSGNACADALEAGVVSRHAVDVGRDVAEVLARLKPDVALNASTGRSARMAASRRPGDPRDPHTHPASPFLGACHAQAPGQDVMQAAGVAVPEGILIRPAIWRRRAHAMAPPYVIKLPNGSSLGVLIVK